MASQPVPDDAPLVGRRKYARLRTHIPVKVVTTQGTFNAVMTGISVSGASIVTDAYMARKSDIILKFLNIDFFCCVEWVADCRAGLSFESLLDPEIIELLRQIDLAAFQEADRQAAARGWVEGSF